MSVNPFNYNIDYFDSLNFGPISDSQFLTYLYSHNLQNIDPAIANTLGITTPSQGGLGVEYDVSQSQFNVIDVPDLSTVANTPSQTNNFTNPFGTNIGSNLQNIDPNVSNTIGSSSPSQAGQGQDAANLFNPNVTVVNLPDLTYLANNPDFLNDFTQPLNNNLGLNPPNVDPAILNAGFDDSDKGTDAAVFVSQPPTQLQNFPDVTVVSNTPSEINDFTQPLDDNLTRNPSFNDLTTWYPNYATIFQNENNTYKSQYGIPATLTLGFAGSIDNWFQDGLPVDGSTQLIENEKKQNKYGPKDLISYDSVIQEIMIKANTGLIEYNLGVQGDLRDELLNRTLGVGVVPFSTEGSGINYLPDGQNISELDKIARQRRGIELKERIRINSIDQTVGIINTSPFSLFAGGAFVLSDFKITRAANIALNALDTFGDVAGFSIPVSYLQDYDFNISIFNKDGTLSNQAVPTNINEVDIKAGLLDRTGNATRSLIFDAINTNKLGPNLEGSYEKFNKGTYLNKTEITPLEDVKEDQYGGFFGTSEAFNSVGVPFSEKSNFGGGDVGFIYDSSKINTKYLGTSTEREIPVLQRGTIDENVDWRVRSNNPFKKGILSFTQNLVNKSKRGDAANYIGYFNSAEAFNGKSDYSQRIDTDILGHSTGVKKPDESPYRSSMGNTARNYNFQDGTGGEYFTRSWSSRRKYSQWKDLVRSSGNWWRGQENNQNMTMNWNEDRTGMPKIAFEKEDLLRAVINQNSVKGAAIPYMFSIENLAWKDAPQTLYLPQCEIGPNGGRIMWFPPYDINFSESVTVNWEATQFIGRGENVYTYNNTERSGTLDFTIIVDHPSVLNELRDNLKNNINNPDGPLHSFFAGTDNETLKEIFADYLPTRNEAFAETERLRDKWLQEQIVPLQGLLNTVGTNLPGNSLFSGITSVSFLEQTVTASTTTTYNCPDGYTYDAGINLCTKTTGGTNVFIGPCQPGITGTSQFNLVCPDSYTPLIDLFPTGSITRCDIRCGLNVPSGSTLSATVNCSDPTYTLSANTTTCYKYTGGTYSFTPVTYSCPSGYVFDPFFPLSAACYSTLAGVTIRSGATIVCSSGYQLSANTTTCFKITGETTIFSAATVTCPTYYTLSAGTTTCYNEYQLAFRKNGTPEPLPGFLVSATTNCFTGSTELDLAFNPPSWFIYDPNPFESCRHVGYKITGETTLTESATAITIVNSGVTSSKIVKYDRAVYTEIPKEIKIYFDDGISDMNQNLTYEITHNLDGTPSSVGISPTSWKSFYSPSCLSGYKYMNMVQDKPISEWLDTIAKFLVTEDGKNYKIKIEASAGKYEKKSGDFGPIGYLGFEVDFLRENGQNISPWPNQIGTGQLPYWNPSELVKNRVLSMKQYLLGKLAAKEELQGGPPKLNGDPNYINYPVETTLADSKERWDLDFNYGITNRNQPRPFNFINNGTVSGTPLFRVYYTDSSQMGYVSTLGVYDSSAPTEPNNPCSVKNYINNTTGDVNILSNSRTQKELRYVKITLIPSTALQADLLSEQIGEENKKFSEIVAESLQKFFITECDYFESMKREQPFVYESLKEKIKYFHPAFHSITPEGLNSRLTFLHQCTRQGPQLLADDVPSNMVFGRPPVCILRIGDFYNTKIVIESVNITYDPLQWDLNPEGIGVQPMLAKVSMGFKFIGGSSLGGPIKQLQNAVSYNFYANTGVYRPAVQVQLDEAITTRQDLIYGALLSPEQTFGDLTVGYSVIQQNAVPTVNTTNQLTLTNQSQTLTDVINASNQGDPPPSSQPDVTVSDNGQVTISTELPPGTPTLPPPVVTSTSQIPPAATPTPTQATTQTDEGKGFFGRLFRKKEKNEEQKDTVSLPTAPGDNGQPEPEIQNATELLTPITDSRVTIKLLDMNADSVNVSNPDWGKIIQNKDLITYVSILRPNGKYIILQITDTRFNTSEPIAGNFDRDPNPIVLGIGPTLIYPTPGDTTMVKAFEIFNCLPDDFSKCTDRNFDLSDEVNFKKLGLRSEWGFVIPKLLRTQETLNLEGKGVMSFNYYTSGFNPEKFPNNDTMLPFYDGDLTGGDAFQKVKAPAYWFGNGNFNLVIYYLPGRNIKIGKKYENYIIELEIKLQLQPTGVP